jgi:hypothetical protein
MAKRATKAQTKMHKVMSEFSRHTLHSGSKKGPIVRSKTQAIAIGLSQSGQSRKGRKRRRK